MQMTVAMDVNQVAYQLAYDSFVSDMEHPVAEVELQ